MADRASRSMSFTEPGRREHTRVAKAVQGPPPLLRLPVRAFPHGHRNLDEPKPLRERFHEQLRCLVLRLSQRDGLGHLDGHGTEAGRRVGDAPPREDGGETPEETLIRELEEELGIVVKEACLAPLTFASHTYPDFHLVMPLYVCRRWDGTVTAKEGQKLAWVRPNRLREYPMPPADVPLVAHLMTLL